MIETNHSITPLSPQFRASISMAVRVLAQRSAVEIVKHQLRARGLKVYSFAHREIVAVAHDYIAAHAELIAEATVTVEERRPEGFFGKRVVRTGHILGSELIKSTIQVRQRGRRRPGNLAPACRSGLRCV